MVPLQAVPAATPALCCTYLQLPASAPCGQQSAHVLGKVGRMDEAELRDAARLARDCVVMVRAVALGRWVGDTGPRPVSEAAAVPATWADVLHGFM